MYSRGKQFVRLALDKMNPQQSGNSSKNSEVSKISVESLLTCDESLSTDNESETDDTIKSDVNNNEQDSLMLGNTYQDQTSINEMVTAEISKFENEDGTYNFVKALTGTLDKEDGDLDLEDTFVDEVPTYKHTHDEIKSSDDLETYPTEVNTLCAYDIEMQNKVDKNKTDDNTGKSEQEADFLHDGMWDEDIDLDDSVKDPDYDPRKDPDYDSKKDRENQSSDEDVPDVMQEIPIHHEEVVTDEPLVKRRKRTSIHEWDKTKQKVARMHGDEYKGMKKSEEGNWRYTEVKSERVMKPRGCSKQCGSSKVKCCTKISEIERKTIFQQFWKEFNWEEKKLYVRGLLAESALKKTGEDKGRKNKSYTYYLRVGDKRYCVCKSMFLNTLGIGEKMAYGWKQAETDVHSRNSVDTEQVPDSEQNTPTRPPSDVRTSARTYLENLPKMESHYCRSTSSKHYVEPVFTSKADLYKVYTEYCKECDMQVASNCLFFNVFEDMNLSLYKPRKDQCDKCCEYEVGNITADEYHEHIKLKDEARNAKANDKDRAMNDPRIKVLTVDLQAVLLCPRLQASALYYKTKLAVHNFTVMDLCTKDTTCYVWNETEGDLCASSFASCTTDYLNKSLELNADVDEVIIYSDGCSYQNRNVVLANALLKTAVDNNVTIVQKYLERGHTQMEVDSIHSLVERKLKRKPIYIPQNYVDVIASCRPSRPVSVKYVNHQFFKDMKNLNYYSSIRPGNRTGDPTVTNIRVLRYKSDGTIQYKLGFSDDYQDLPRTAKVQNKPVGAVTQLHQNRIPIKGSKFKHLQELKSVVPPDYHFFYDSLPHKDD